MECDRGAGPILVVDDSPEIARLMTIVLREDGFCVQAAATHEEALSKARLETPVLVLLDVGLPPTDDEAFVSALRARHGQGIPIILISGVSDAQLQSAAQRTGAVDAIREPFDIDDLVARVRRAVDGRDLRLHRADVLALVPVGLALIG